MSNSNSSEATNSCGEYQFFFASAEGPAERQLPVRMQDDLYCKQRLDVDDSYVIGVCNKIEGGCVEQGMARDFSGDEAPDSSECTVQPTPCVFPFTDPASGVTHDKCASATTADGREYNWCATAVYEGTTDMIEGMWGECNMESCVEVPRAAVVTVDGDSNSNGVAMNIKFTQASPIHPLLISGVVRGADLEGGSSYGFAVHEKQASGDDCDSAGRHYNVDKESNDGPIVIAPTSEVWVTGDFGNIHASADDVTGEVVAKVIKRISEQQASLFGRLSILDRSLVVSTLPDDLGLGQGEAEDELRKIFAGRRLACGVIKLAVVESEAEKDYQLTKIVIYVGIIIAALIILAIIAFLIYWCLYRRGFWKPKQQPVPQDDEPEKQPQEQSTNGPFGGELRFPLIDATPDGSPRPGRSTDRLAYLNSRSSSIGRSRGSLSEKEGAV